VVDELAAQGKSIPGDVSVCCVDDPALPAFVRPKFTYVEQPGYAMGAAAVEIVLQALRTGTMPPGDREFPASLHIGESCGEREPSSRAREQEAIARR
jgi:LacI family transcriptional regulator